MVTVVVEDVGCFSTWGYLGIYLYRASISARSELARLKMYCT